MEENGNEPKFRGGVSVSGNGIEHLPGSGGGGGKLVFPSCSSLILRSGCDCNDEPGIRSFFWIAISRLCWTDCPHAHNRDQSCFVSRTAVAARTVGYSQIEREREQYTGMSNKSSHITPSSHYVGMYFSNNYPPLCPLSLVMHPWRALDSPSPPPKKKKQKC